MMTYAVCFLLERSKIMTFKSFAPYTRAYMDEYVKDGEALVFSRDTNLFKTKTNDIITPYQSIVCRYYDSLKSYITTMTFSGDEKDRYKYNPRFLSYDLYGTPELWAELLYINNMVSVAEFKKTTVNIFTTDIIDALLEIKLIIENDLIDNKASIKE